jgi:SNF2 family DNA or RNA helicase
MVNRILLDGDSIVLLFKYEPRIINVVREIDGRRWNAEKKQWEVPVTNIVQACDALKVFGFVLREDVKKKYYERKDEIDEIKNLKANNDAKYDGKLPLYDFQRAGAVMIKRLPAMLLADVPGLGKTLQTGAAFEELQDQILIWVPASLKFNWLDELKKWLPDQSALVINGTKQQRTEQWIYAIKGLSGKQPKWVIANYELLIHDADIFEKYPKVWGAIVCDEADRIANPSAITTKKLKMLKSKKRLALTGTPVSNKPDDLWSIIDWLYPSFLGSYGQFQKKYCKLHPKWNRVIGYQNLEALRASVDPIMLRRLKEQVLKDFPPKTIEYIRFDLEGKERDLYQNVKASLITEIKKMASMNTWSLNLLPVKMLRLKQCTDHSALVGGEVESTKLKTLKEMLKPIVASGEKALVFTQFAAMADILATELAEYNPLVIQGSVDSQMRKAYVDEFTTDQNRKILIMTEAGTYGLNVQAATYVFHYDAPWSVSKLEQREGRAHRVGQDKPVTVYHLVAKNTIDEYILKVLAKKKGMSVDILGDEPEEKLDLADIEEILDEEI